MIRGFTHDQPAIRVVFAAGAFDRLGEEIERLGAKRALFIASPRWRDAVAAL